MLKSYSQKTAVSALLVALGVIIPYLTGHGIGVPGTVFLPMHPVAFLAGFLAGPFFGVAVGLLTPLASSLLTQMPPAFPMLPIMMGELATYGLISGLMTRLLFAGTDGRSVLSKIWPFCSGELRTSLVCKSRKNAQREKVLTFLKIYPCLVVAQLFGRITYALIFEVLTGLSDTPIRALSPLGATGAIATGLPGLAIQWILLPPIIFALFKIISPRKSATDPTFQKAKDLIRSEKASIAIIKSGKILHTASGRGISPLLDLYSNSPELLKSAFVCDKIVGKAAAMVLVASGVSRVWTKTISRAAAEFLAENGIAIEFERKIEVIENRTKTGICPLEQSVWSVDDAKVGIEILHETLEKLRQAV